MNINKNEIKITDMDISARGIGKVDGKVIFVPDAVTDDTVICETVLSKKRYDTAKIIEIKSPSKHRITPKCRNYENCGGCSFLHVSRELELETKRKSVEASFRRAGIKSVPVEKIISGKAQRYRNKAVYHLGINGKYGFYSAESHTCYECTDCLLVPDIFNSIINYVQDYFTNNAPKSIMLRIGNGDVMMVLETDTFGKYSEFFDKIAESFSLIVSCYECLGYPTDYQTEYRLCRGKKYIQCDFSGNKLNISPKSFFQVNTEIAKLVCDEIASRLDLAPRETVLDLYCGIGTIGLTVARRFPKSRVFGVEINSSAVSDAMENSRISGIENAEFICSDAGHAELTAINPKAVIVDPPRYGLTDSMISSLLQLSPDVLIYMSCNPSSLAGNSLKLTDKYEISECIAADMFPGCSHVESITVFKKR